ncbi:MAG: UDP-N-acetylmuramate--L-alanine ligase [Deltaproteobacteria bacterium]|nr:MAG: UDP-N-acetylmuramate--L-alanine ligase [Deltaproteobacteria bacterium]
MYPTLKDIHFVGIGGIGMSGIAEILLTLGCRVSGSDVKSSPVTNRLKRRGAKVYIGHKSDNLKKAQVVVTSSAVSKTNPEVLRAQKEGIPVIARAEMLAELMRLKYGIAVAGSHGKTTTTSLVASILDVGGLDPTMVIGGRVRNFRTNARLGKGDYLVAEADESDGSFLHLNPTIAVVTNIDREHMDHYRDFDSLRQTFEEFSAKIPFFGLAVFCADHPETAKMAEHFTKRKVTYGIHQKADYQAKKIHLKGWGSEFEVTHGDHVLGKVHLNLPGMHNILNSLAAIAVGCELGIKFSHIRKALKEFRGIGRRLEKIHEGDVSIIDDYGHHPVEIKATLSALRQAIGKKKLWVLFQPHRYTRTKDLMADFPASFEEADHVVVTDIYAASEEPIQGVSGKILAESIQSQFQDKTVQYIPLVTEIADAVSPHIHEGDFVLTLGAGDIYKAGKMLAEKYG